MAITGTKLKDSVLDRLRSEGDNQNKGGNVDSRFLEYFKLPDKGKIELLFVPSPDGQLHHYFTKHGPNLQNPKVGSIRCLYESKGDNCPICQYYFDNYGKAKDRGDNEGMEYYRKFKKKAYYIYQVVVLQSDIEIEYPDDNNLVKLVYLPSSVHQLIKQSLSDGDVDDPTEYVFRLRKNIGNNNQPSYHTSRFLNAFDPDQYPEIVEAVENDLIQPYDFNTLDIIPEKPSQEQAKEWLHNAIEITSGSEDSSQSQSAPSKQPSTSQSSEETVQQYARTDYDEGDENEESANSSSSISEGNPSGKSKAEQIRDRLKNKR